MESEGSHGPYPEPDQSSPYHHILSLLNSESSRNYKLIIMQLIHPFLRKSISTDSMTNLSDMDLNFHTTHAVSFNSQTHSYKNLEVCSCSKARNFYSSQETIIFSSYGVS
jgi:hypothetical protein